MPACATVPPIEFIERRRLNISTIYRLTVKGSF